MNDREGIGRRIAEIRKIKGISQSDLAAQVGITQEHVSRIENGKYSPRLDIIAKIAEVLACKVDDFLSFDHLKS